jgi:hypothetical protein
MQISCILWDIVRCVRKHEYPSSVLVNRSLTVSERSTDIQIFEPCAVADLPREESFPALKPSMDGNLYVPAARVLLFESAMPPHCADMNIAGLKIHCFTEHQGATAGLVGHV